MRLLLDSHILLWWDSDLSKLSITQRAVIEDPANQVYVSPVSAWELGIKSTVGKLKLQGSVRDLVRRWGFAELPITMAHGERAAELPLLHKDPFDRMLIAQAMTEGMVLVSADSKLAEYGVAVL